MTEDTYRVGIIGCGWAGRGYGEAVDNHDQMNLVAATEPNPPTLDRFVNEFGPVEAYEGHEQMLETEELDIVSICTWPNTHASITVAAAEAGVDGIVCEKPMCTNLGEADDMLDAAERNDTRLVVGTQRRYTPVHQKARQLIADGEIGEPMSVTACTNGGLFNWGTHIIDLSRYLLGDPDLEWVIGQLERRTERYERGEPIEDLCAGQICFEEGTRLSFECDTPSPDLTKRGHPIEIHGSEGTLSLELGSAVHVLNATGTETYAPETDRKDRTTLLDDLVVWMADEQHDHRCSGQHARATMEIMMSMYESARKNEVVTAPLETRANPLKVMLDDGELEPEYPGKYDTRIPYSSLDDS